MRAGYGEEGGKFFSPKYQTERSMFRELYQRHKRPVDLVVNHGQKVPGVPGVPGLLMNKGFR